MQFCFFQIICELRQPFRKISQTVVRISTVIPLFIFVFGLFEVIRTTSCDVDDDDELLPELVGNPGTTRGTKLSVLRAIVFTSLVIRGF